MSDPSIVEEGLDDGQLLASLPARARWWIYAKGVWSLIPPWAAFPLGMALGGPWAIHAEPVDPQAQASWVSCLMAGGAAVLALALFSAGKWLFQPEDWTPRAQSLRKVASLALAFGCMAAMAGLWGSSPPYPWAEVEAAYRSDAAAIVKATSLEEAQKIWWQRGELAKGLMGCMLCERPDVVVEGGSIEAPPLSELLGQASLANGREKAWCDMALVTIACMLDLALPGLALMTVGLGRRGLSAAKSARSAASRLRVGSLWIALGGSARRAARAPGAVKGWAAMSAAAVRRAAAAKVFSDPQARADYERRVLEAGTSPSDSIGSGPARL